MVAKFLRFDRKFDRSQRQPLAGKSALAAASFCAYPKERGILCFDANFKFSIFVLLLDK